jgi:8-oxo-dGTP pyrophosphatase MutT (NUDIX family)
MPVPPYVLELRRHIGTAELWLPGVTAVIRRGTGADTEILLVRRSDNGEWTPVTGIVDPGEDPGVTARREAMEETGVEISVDRLASVSAGERVSYANGDRAVYLDHTFACTWLSGEAHVADDESTEVGWYRRDGLPQMQPVAVERIEVACSDETRTRFRA